MNYRYTGIFLFALLLILGSASSCKVEEASATEPETEQDTSKTETNTGFQIRKSDLELLTVRNQNQQASYAITGRVIPKNSIQVVAEVQGRVLKNNFSLREGTTFQAGSTLLSVDAKEFSLQLESQRAAFLNLLTSMMPDIKADYPDSYQKWLGYISAYESGERLKALPSPQSEEERYFLIAHQVFSTFYGIQAQEERLQKFSIQAPFSGVVTKSMTDIGGFVAPGQPLATLINNTQYELEAGVNLAAIEALKRGIRLTFRQPKTGKTYEGTFIRSADIVDATTQNIPVFFSLSGNSIKSGLYLEGEIETESYQKAVELPARLLTRDQ
ncbi:MAG: HlyD family efflux transporter periplasmic adaptor subunit, partial [Bacteroidota bacterium]